MLVKPMPSLPRLLAIICLGVVLVLLSITALLGREQMLAIIFGPVHLTAIDFHTLTRSNRPNQYLVCPLNLCTTMPDAVSPVYEVPVTMLRERWLSLLAQQPRLEQIAVSKDGWQYDFIQHSRLLRFPDSITLRFLPLGEQRSTLAIYSRSHYGYTDFGVNRKRVETWLTIIWQSGVGSSRSTAPLARVARFSRKIMKLIPCGGHAGGFGTPAANRQNARW
jgi:uncharacterized protein (DUF1499 family)